MLTFNTSRAIGRVCVNFDYQQCVVNCYKHFNKDTCCIFCLAFDQAMTQVRLLRVTCRSKTSVLFMVGWNWEPIYMIMISMKNQVESILGICGVQPFSEVQRFGQGWKSQAHSQLLAVRVTHVVTAGSWWCICSRFRC